MVTRFEYGKSPIISLFWCCPTSVSLCIWFFFKWFVFWISGLKVSQLMETTRRLEARIKFNQKLQWITVLVFLLLSIAIVYILKIEINNSVSSGSEYCSSRSKHYWHPELHTLLCILNLRLSGTKNKQKTPTIRTGKGKIMHLEFK